MKNKLTPPLKTHGGKHYLAQRIIDLFPPHLHYVEPYFGGGAVLLQKDPHGISEVTNDINEELTVFWKVLQNPAWFYAFQRCVEAMPFSEWEWQQANELDLPDTTVEQAVNFFIRSRMSLAGRGKTFTPITKTRTRRGMNNEASAWLSAVEGLPEIHARLKRVLILNRDAIDVIRSQDGPETLIYADPPYLKSTRTAPDVYAHEMTEEQHKELLGTLLKCKGKVVLSGYRSELYDTILTDWRRVDFEIPNHAAGGKAKRKMTESVWLNYQ